MSRIFARVLIGLLALTFAGTNLQDGHRQPGPTIVTFRADPARILLGESSTLKWRVTGATKVSLSSDADSPPTWDRFLGDVDAEGQLEISPAETTAFVLQADGPGGTVMRSVTLRVSDPSRGLGTIDKIELQQETGYPRLAANLHHTSTLDLTPLRLPLEGHKPIPNVASAVQRFRSGAALDSQRSGGLISPPSPDTLPLRGRNKSDQVASIQQVDSRLPFNAVWHKECCFNTRNVMRRQVGAIAESVRPNKEHTHEYC